MALLRMKMRNFGTIILVVMFFMIFQISYYQSGTDSTKIQTHSNIISPNTEPVLDNSSFVRIHLSIVVNGTSTKVVFNKSPSTGYGNRVYSMLSAFLVAVVTESALVIDWPKIENFIDFALPHSFDKFKHTSFLNPYFEIDTIHKIKSSSSNVWAYNKSLKALKGKFD